MKYRPKEEEMYRADLIFKYSIASGIQQRAGVYRMRLGVNNNLHN